MIQLLPGIRIKVPNKHSTYGRVKLKTIQLLPGLRIKVPNRHSTYGRVKVKNIQLISGKYRGYRLLKPMQK